MNDVISNSKQFGDVLVLNAKIYGIGQGKDHCKLSYRPKDSLEMYVQIFVQKTSKRAGKEGIKNKEGVEQK